MKAEHLDLFMPFFQMMAAINLGLIFIDRSSGIVKIQKAFVQFYISTVKPELARIGSLTQRCKTNQLSKTDEGRITLALAEKIRARKISFKTLTDIESKSVFLPSLGALSGFIGLVYLLIEPYYRVTGDICFMHYIEYIAEAGIVSMGASILSFLSPNSFPTRISVLLSSLLWFFVSLLIFVLFDITGNCIECFNLDFYLLFLIAMQFVPSLFVFFCIIYMIVARRRRFRLIKKTAKELENRLY